MTSPALIESHELAQDFLSTLVEMIGTAEALKITNDDEYTAAAELLQELKGAYNRGEEKRKELVKPLNDEVRAINSEWKPVKEAYDKGESVIKRAIAHFQREQRRKAEEEQARIRAQQEKEQKKLAERAAKWEAKGNEQKAEQLREQAENMPVAQVAPETPKVAGMHTRKVWKYEITDPEQIPRQFLIPDEKSIDAVVKAQGKRAEQTLMGSVTVWEEDVVVSRAR